MGRPAWAGRGPPGGPPECDAGAGSPLLRPFPSRQGLPAPGPRPPGLRLRGARPAARPQSSGRPEDSSGARDRDDRRAGAGREAPGGAAGGSPGLHRLLRRGKRRWGEGEGRRRASPRPGALAARGEPPGGAGPGRVPVWGGGAPGRSPLGAEAGCRESGDRSSPERAAAAAATACPKRPARSLSSCSDCVSVSCQLQPRGGAREPGAGPARPVTARTANRKTQNSRPRPLARHRPWLGHAPGPSHAPSLLLHCPPALGKAQNPEPGSADPGRMEGKNNKGVQG